MKTILAKITVVLLALAAFTGCTSDATEPAEVIVPTDEIPGKTDIPPHRPISTPSSRERDLASLLPEGRRLGRYRIMPFKTRNSAIQFRLRFMADVFGYRKNASASGISMVASRRKSSSVRTSTGRFLRRLGTRASRR